MRTSSIFAILLAIVAAVGATPVKRERPMRTAFSSPERLSQRGFPSFKSMRFLYRFMYGRIDRQERKVHNILLLCQAKVPRVSKNQVEESGQGGGSRDRPWMY
ncbi:hypothetical protein B0F90DRAFT_1670882 [Multifurca ochricompacta]|uniref:Uncharacterized protein n=1 Tax=Multifurca ochricompacta TaxID=376703 RepID=A0AAD4QGE7_9AGAM|nr:hypothetical protein B0F90DRAFT_1670882 [Multifurca ochricompacta]